MTKLRKTASKANNNISTEHVNRETVEELHFEQVQTVFLLLPVRDHITNEQVN